MASEPTPVVSFENKPTQTQQAFSMEQKQKAVPAYTVEPMKRKTVVNRTVKDEIGFRVVPTDVEVEGYMVRTLRGDSAFVTHDDLVRMKLDKNLGAAIHGRWRRHTSWSAASQCCIVEQTETDARCTYSAT